VDDSSKDSVENAERSAEESKADSNPSSSKSKGLSFSSGKPTTKTSVKRKAITRPDSESEDDLASKMGIKKLGPIAKGKDISKDKDKGKGTVKKKSKKESKKLLSFGDEA
jgi:hypothetical protein